MAASQAAVEAQRTAQLSDWAAEEQENSLRHHQVRKKHLQSGFRRTQLTHQQMYKVCQDTCRSICWLGLIDRLVATLPSEVNRPGREWVLNGSTFMLKPTQEVSWQSGAGAASM